MSYIGYRLEPLFDRTPVHRVLVRMAERGGERMTELVKQNTPIGHRPFSADYVPGKLRESIEKKLLVVRRTARGDVYETGCETNLEYAIYVEEGTGIYHEPDPHSKWRVKPKNPDGWLSWIDQQTGERRFAKEVEISGMAGSHMFAIGAALTEHEFNIFGQREVQRWAREQERQGMQQRPVYWGRRVA